MRIKFLTFLLIAGSLYAQEENSDKSTFTLKEAQQYALENGYAVTDKRLEYEKARQTIKETAAIGLPQISAALDFNYNAVIDQVPIGDQVFPMGTPYSNKGSINLNQLLLDGSFFIALQGTKVLKDIALQDIDVTELQIRREVSEAYYGVLVAEESVRIIKENLESLRKSFTETKALYDNGFVEEQDVDQIELLIVNLSNSLNRAERQYSFSKMLLNFNLGRPVEKEIAVISSIVDVMVVEDLLLNNPFEVEKNASFILAETREYGAGLNVKAERWKYYPTLSGFVRHGQSIYGQGASDVFDFNTYWIPSTTLGVSLKWNILEGLKRPATVQKAKLDLNRAELNSELTENQLKLDYEGAKTTYQFAFDNYNSQVRNVELAKKIRDKTYVKYQEGISSSLDLTQAENQYLDAQQQYITSIQTLLNAKEGLIQAIGQ